MSDIFDWDTENILHIAAHDVSPEEFEQVVERFPVDLDYQVVNGEVRYLQIGMTAAGRILTILSTLRGDRIRPITAFSSTKKQAAAYFRWRS